ncbi:MAG: 16S rRNA (adenine(1518)-N(6)/adenine(1519)-N(6))-dimethyltransferase RsmA [Candidatus Ratteibacteria bacterium]|nr:16S rRNA (adenine(1518)-N(6)/adenine(1519)-N(6))-dimethyltransferase RsmA [Candidatus Ratteibacteria bacterium]
MEFLTLKKCLELLQARDINIKKYLGQHLLIDRNARDKLLSFAELDKDDVVVEIGPGMGALTDGIIEKVRDVYAFEIDPAFCDILRTRFSEYPNFHLIEKDFLETKREWWEMFDRKVKVIGNTPYYISLPIVFKILNIRDRIELSLLTVQKEVGKRLTAVPKSKDYSVISVLLSIYCQAKICYLLKRDVFFPKPEVDSVVVKLIPLETPLIKIENEKEFWDFLPRIFSLRRKKISNVTHKIFGIEKGSFKKLLKENGISPDVRVETLTPEEIYRVFKIITVLTKEKRHGYVDRC